jgi:transketolase
MKPTNASPLNDLAAVANRLRRRVLEMCHAHGGHISTAYSCVEILVSLYYTGILRVDPAAPEWDGRDRFVLSKGHGETILYALLADRGFFPEEWTRTRYRSGDCVLGGHVDCKVPGVEVTAGALGHGLGLGCGMALAAQMDGRETLHYVLLGDAECAEGSIWEAALFAAQWQLGQLVAIVDHNRIGSLDYTANYIALDPLAQKWRAFGWDVVEVDGHDFEQLRGALEVKRAAGVGRPRMVIANTTKGKGVSAFENDPVWHVKPVTDDYLEIGMRELGVRDAQ